MPAINLQAGTDQSRQRINGDGTDRRTNVFFLAHDKDSNQIENTRFRYRYDANNRLAEAISKTVAVERRLRSMGAEIVTFDNNGSVEGVVFAGGPASIDGIHVYDQIRTLDLTNAQLTDPNLGSLKCLRQLQYFGLANTIVSDSDVESVAKLINPRHLDLRNTLVTDRTLEIVESLSRLQSVDISGTAATQDGVKILASRRPTLKVVYQTGKTLDL